MQQAYLSPIFQDVEKQYTELGAWHHRLQTDHKGVLYTGGEIQSDPQTGLPTEEALLVYVDVEPTQHAVLARNPHLITFPVALLDMRACDVLGIEALRRRVEALMGPSNAWAGTWRDVLNYYGRLNNSAFDADDFT